MAKYKALKRGFCECVREVGVEFEYGGQPDDYWMEPLDDAAKAAVEALKAAKPEAPKAAEKKPAK